jgi:hypothetical protein
MKKRNRTLGYAKRPAGAKWTDAKRVEWAVDNIKVLLDPYNYEPRETRCENARRQAAKAERLLARISASSSHAWTREIQAILDRVAKKCSR